jgi:hypothetical protein
MYPIGKKEIQKTASRLGIEISNETPSPGDAYLCGRNTGVQMFTCNRVENGCVFPEERGYPYNTAECYKVKT